MKSHFQRKEIKYRLTKGQMDSLIALLGDELVFDFYCPTGQPYHISSIYYDTPNYDVIRRSNDKPRHKAKLRLRTYEDNSHYLELKQKYRGIVYKKRIALSEQELGEFIRHRILPNRSDYESRSVLADMAGFLALHPDLIKPVHIEYHRIAYVYNPTKENVRMTFDSRLRVYEEARQSWVKLLPSDEVLMEIKVVGTMPLTLVKALSALKIYPHSFSKYGKYFKQQLIKGEISYV